MTKVRLFGAAALLVSCALASPVMAQEVIYNPGYCAQFYPNANCQNKGPGNPYTGDYQRRVADRNNGDWNSGWHDSCKHNPRDRLDSGFWTGDVAAGVVGGAIGTAGAIATAPFRGDSYAYYNADSYGYQTNVYRGGPHQSYAPQRYEQLNGFVCHPGTLFTGEDGRRHICQ